MSRLLLLRFAAPARFVAPALALVSIFARPLLLLALLVAVLTAVHAGILFADTGAVPSLDASVGALVAMPNSLMNWAACAIALASIICSRTSTPLSTTSWGAIYQILEAIAFNTHLAKQVHPAELAPPAPAKPALSATAAALLGCLILGGVVVACTSAQLQQAQQDAQTVAAKIQTVAGQFCQKDGQIIPVIQTDAGIVAAIATPLAPSVGTTLGTLVTVDATVVHPLVQKACADIGAIVVAPAVPSPAVTAIAAPVAIAAPPVAVTPPPPGASVATPATSP